MISAGFGALISGTGAVAIDVFAVLMAGDVIVVSDADDGDVTLSSTAHAERVPTITSDKAVARRDLVVTCRTGLVGAFRCVQGLHVASDFTARFDHDPTISDLAIDPASGADDQALPGR